MTTPPSLRTALVTGAGRGIGKTIARRLAESGMPVGINDVNPTLVQQVVAEFRADGLSALGLPGDVSNKTDVTDMFDHAEAELGSLWLLVNNAGVYNAAPTADLAEEMWDRVMAVDLKGVFLCSQAAIRRMAPRGGGRIVNISSIGGVIVRTGQLAYCAAKAAVVHITRCLAVEMAPHGITVNCVCPGSTNTEMLTATSSGQAFDMDALLDMIPDRKLAEEVDHANLIAYFASDVAAHVTGQVVTVDGGQSLFHPFVMRR
jgi:NAD(P)-dependent dehydrogenase (short-subunit alcohol dehydrogenase family)